LCRPPPASRRWRRVRAVRPKRVPPAAHRERGGTGTRCAARATRPPPASRRWRMVLACVPPMCVPPPATHEFGEKESSSLIERPDVSIQARVAGGEEGVHEHDRAEAAGARARSGRNREPRGRRGDVGRHETATRARQGHAEQALALAKPNHPHVARTVGWRRPGEGQSGASGDRSASDDGAGVGQGPRRQTGRATSRCQDEGRLERVAGRGTSGQRSRRDARAQARAVARSECRQRGRVQGRRGEQAR
jgi:hypothetical protein